MRQSIRDLVRLFSEFLPEVDPVVEIGSLWPTSQGAFADLRPYFTGRPYIGMDIQEGAGVDMVCQEGKLPLQDGEAGTVLLIDTMEHVADPSAMIEEVRRVLRPDGFVIITSVFNFPIHNYPSDFWRFTPAGIQRLLQDFPETKVWQVGYTEADPVTVVGIAAKQGGRFPETLDAAVNEWKMDLERRGKLIPLFRPPRQSVDRMIEELRDTLSGQWWGQGPKVEHFESWFGTKFGFPYCAMVNSGTAALWLAYNLVGVKPGDEVIVPVLTCTATCHPLLHMGAKIVFADIRPDTLTADIEDVKTKISARTRAIVNVHLGGLVWQPEEWADLQAVTGIPIIEDAAQALGAPGLGQAKFTAFSFQAIKALSTGDGGALCTHSQHYYDAAKRLRWFDIDREQKARKGWQAWDRRGITFDQYLPGYKFQATDIDAAIGLAGLETFDKSQEHRASLAAIYRSHLLFARTGVKLLNEGPTSNWLFMVLVQGDRDDFAAALLGRGIETNVAHIRNDLFSVFGGERQNLPGMNAVEKQYLCLPINDHVTEDDVRYICRVIRNELEPVDG